MSHLRTEDDLIHATGAETGWREAFYFDFIDPDSGLSGFGYSGVHPNQEIGDVIFALWQRDVLLARFTRWDFNVPRDIGAGRLDFGPLCFRQARPFEAWQMRFDDGFCSLRLDFSAIHPAYSWADSETALAETSSHHYEQQGTYTGTARVGADEYTINGIGVRDHAWGWGARAGITHWLWASAQFSHDLAFNGFQISLADGRDVHYGYIWRGEGNEFLQRSRMTAAYGPDGKVPASFTVELDGRDNGQISAAGEVISAFDISHQERNKQGYHFFCATEYEAEGRKGYGHANFHWRGHRYRPGDWTVTQS
jgi:hypothetical protein